MYKLKSKEEIKKWIASEVIDTSEARALLNCSRQYISELVSKEKLIPIKTASTSKLFFKSDVKLIKNESDKHE